MGSVTLRKRLLSALKKKEPGDGGISYAMYFIAVVISLTIFIFALFNAKILVVEEVVENGLHISENKVLSSSQEGNPETEAYGKEKFERDLSVLHIITKATPNNGWDPLEYDQVIKVGNELAVNLQEHLGLTGANPTSGILMEMCDESSIITLRASEGKSLGGNAAVGAVIYEPFYSVTVSDAGDAATGTNPYKIHDFDISYDITGWAIYYITYTEGNVVASVTKDYTTATPMIYNKKGHDQNKEAEGATIEAAVSMKFHGIKNIFDGVTSAGGPLFSRNPTQVADNSICVVQSADIVPINNDSRKQ